MLNTSLFPYMDRFVLDHLNDPEWGLSPDDVWTFKARYYDAASYSYKDNPPNPGYVPGQDPERDRYRDVVRDIRDYGPMRRGVIPNSHARANSLNLGTAYVDDRLAVGIGYQCDYAYYGVPAYAKIPEAGHTHTHADGTVHLFAVQQPFLPINVRSSGRQSCSWAVSSHLTRSCWARRPSTGWGLRAGWRGWSCRRRSGFS